MYLDWLRREHLALRALALENEPEFKLTQPVLRAFYAGYGSAPLDDRTCSWFGRLYNYVV